MSKHKISVLGTENGALSFAHDGKGDQGYCEAGETVRLNWQPSAGWGLQEAHYTTATDPDTAVAIDLTQREFTMPADDITISGTFKKFAIGDWTSGTDAASNAGKVLGFDEGGNLVPVEGGGGGGEIPEEIKIKDQDGVVWGIVVDTDGSLKVLAVTLKASYMFFVGNTSIQFNNGHAPYDSMTPESITVDGVASDLPLTTAGGEEWNASYSGELTGTFTGTIKFVEGDLVPCVIKSLF